MMEKEAARQLTRYLNNKEIIPAQQFGFRKKSSCEVALLLSLDWMGHIDSGSMVGALLIDLSKAFDTIPHQKLILELADVGCSSHTLNWFLSYLSDRRQRVVQRPIVTEWKMVTRGAPQGGGLSPLFFKTYVRNLPQTNQSTTMQFADDTTISEPGRNLQDINDKLTQSFNNIKQYCDERELIVNAQKTQFIIFKVPRKKIPSEFEITIDGCPIKPASSVKLLGVTLDQHLTFKEHIDNISKKCHSILGALARASPYLSRDLLKLAYTALVRSRLEYASAVYASASNTQLNKLEIIQKIASRIICGVSRNAHSAPLLEALDLEALSTRRSKHIAELVKSIVAGDCHPAMEDMFTELEDGSILCPQTSRIDMGTRRFSVFAAEQFNRLVM